jgi:hypothetical protein
VLEELDDVISEVFDIASNAVGGQIDHSQGGGTAGVFGQNDVALVNDFLDALEVRLNRFVKDFSRPDRRSEAKRFRAEFSFFGHSFSFGVGCYTT